MTNLTKIINTYIFNTLENVPLISNDVFSDLETDAIISRHSPSEFKPVQYVDGSSEGELNISYYARYKKAQDSRKVLSGILELLDGKVITDETTGSYYRIKTSSVTQPQFIECDDKGFTVYMATVNAMYYRN